MKLSTVEKIARLVGPAIAQAIMLLKSEERDAKGEEARLLRQARILLEESVSDQSRSLEERARGERRRAEAVAKSNEAASRKLLLEAEKAESYMRQYADLAQHKKQEAYELLRTLGKTASE